MDVEDNKSLESKPIICDELMNGLMKVILRTQALNIIHRQITLQQLP